MEAGTVSESKARNPQNPQAQRWLRQILLYRYQLLLQKIEKEFSLTDDQRTTIEKQILNLSWIDRAYEK